MTQEIDNFLNILTPNWKPIKEQTTKYFDTESKIRDDGAAQIFRRPWVAPQNFGLLLFPPVDLEWFDKFNEKTNLTIPKMYQDILSEMNGCFVYDFSLFGLPKTMYTTGLLSRTVLQQYDLGTANTTWIHNYDIDTSLFHIGGRAYSYEENVGYFIDNNKIVSIKENGEIVGSWTTFADFLKEEINIAEQMMLKEKEEL
jgi:hypothetical protein